MATYYADSAGNDGNAGTAPGSGTAFLTLQKLLDTVTAGDIGYAKNDQTYNEMVDIDTNVGTAALPINIHGYNATPGDGGKATIDGQNSRTDCLRFNHATMAHVNFHNFILTGGTSACINNAFAAQVNHIGFFNIVGTDGSGNPSSFARASGGSFFTYCLFNRMLIENMSSNGLDGTILVGKMFDSVIRNNGAAGLNCSAFRDVAATIYRCLIYGNVTSGVVFGGSNSHAEILYNTIVNNGAGGTGHAISINGSDQRLMTIQYNLLAGHAGTGEHGINCGSLSGTTKIFHGNNFYYNNATNKHANLPATIIDDILLSADPFVNAAGGDFRLNTTAGGGADVRAAGGIDFDGTNISYADGGALQHLESAGGAGGARSVFIGGGVT